jgi:succinate-semialdehyde dehydrogenase/glutarate-semialdehyde dehydrogenase
LVHHRLAEEFAQRFAAQAQALQVGDGLSTGTQMGPLANGRRLAAMQSIVQDARAKGAQVLTGGERIGMQGNFFAPTVLSHVPLDADVLVHEPFGPIAAIRSFEKIEDAIAEANRLPFGLAAYAFTNSMTTLHQLSQRLEVGMLWVNQPAAPWPELPFGGMKDSGYGSEGGPEALEAYLHTKTVSVFHV